MDKLVKKYDPATGKDYVGKIQVENMGYEPDKTYTHSQSTPSVLWTVEHNLHKNPCVTVLSETGTEFFGAVEHLSSDILIIKFKKNKT